MRALTTRQTMVLDFITKHIEEHGIPPTLREIGRHMGIRSTNGVNDHLHALEKKGFITRDLMKSRAIRVVAKPPVTTDVPGVCLSCQRYFS